MFWNKKMKAIEERLAKLEQFEKSVSTICDNYFATNEKHDLSFSTGCSADKFYHFVKSVDERLKELERELIEKSCDLELKRKENETLKAELVKECEEHQQFCETAKKKVDEQQAVINAQEKEINELRKPKTATAKGGKKKWG